MIGALLQAAALCGALTSPEVPAARACAAALPMVALCADPALLAAIAIGESRLVVDAVNPRTGACGIGQVVYSRARNKRCAIDASSTWNGVEAMVARLDAWALVCRRIGTPGALCSIAGYRSGIAAARGRRYRGARMILRRAQAIRGRWQATSTTRARRAAGTTTDLDLVRRSAA